MAVLIDTNIFLAAAHTRDQYHLQARAALRELRDKRIVPVPVLQETFHLVADRVSYEAATRLLKTMEQGAFQIEPLASADIQRMTEIMAQYKDNAFDFTDVALMVIAERLNITEIYTFDRRDFVAFRPTHCDYFELLP